MAVCRHRLAESGSIQAAVVMRRERTVTFVVGDVLELEIWEFFTFFGGWEYAGADLEGKMSQIPL